MKEGSILCPANQKINAGEVAWMRRRYGDFHQEASFKTQPGA
jgi:hypothetical protein